MSEYDDFFCDCIADEDEELCIKMSEDGTCPIIVRKRENDEEIRKLIEQLEKEEEKKCQELLTME